MIILYPGYSFQSLVTDLTEIEASEVLAAYTALFHPAIFKHFGKIPQLQSANGTTPDNTTELIVVPPCCEQFPAQNIENYESENNENKNNTKIIRNLKSRKEITNEIIKQFNITHKFKKEIIEDFYTLGTTVLLVNLLAHHLHYMDNSNDSSIVEAFQNIINSINNIDDNNNNSNNIDNNIDNNTSNQSDSNLNSDPNIDANIIVTKNQTDKNDTNPPESELSELVDHKLVTHNLFRDAFERICETKECYYPISSYLLDLTLVVQSTLGEPFRRLLLGRDSVNVFLPSLLLDLLPEIDSFTFEVLKSATASGKVDFVVDDVSEVPLLLFPILEVADKILQGVSIYRERLGISPVIYGRHRVGFAPFLPQILKLAGFKGVLYFSPFDGWYLKQQNQSKMIWRGTDGTKIDALIRYPMKCTTNKEFFDFADNYSNLINSDSVPTGVFASFPVDKNKKIKTETAEKSDTDNYCNNNPDVEDVYELEDPDWCADLHRVSNFTSQLGEFVKLESYFASTSQTGSEESIPVENYITGEPSDIPFWQKIYRDSLTRTVVSAFGTVSQLLNQKKSDKSDLGSVRNSVSAFISAAGLCRAEGAVRNRRCGIAIFNAWNFGRRVFIDVSDWSSLPAVISPIVFAGENEGKKELVVDVPPLGYVVIPAPEKLQDNNSFAATESKNITQQNQANQANQISPQKSQPLKNQSVTEPDSPKSRWNIFRRLFGKKSKPLLISESEDKKAFFLQNEFFVAKVDSDTGMLRSLLTGNYRYNRLSQQLGFRLPKALREVDSRPPNDPNRGYASSIVDDIFIDELGSVTGRLKICGRLVCDDGYDAAKFTEFVTVRRFSRILEFNFAIEPLVEPSGDSAWDSYYAIRSAWNDSSLELRGNLGDGVYSVTKNRVLSPRFIDLRTERRAITFFTEGLPFHRRFGERYLDTILIAKGDNKYDAEGNKIDNNKIDGKEDIDESSNSRELLDKLTSDSASVVRKFRFGVGIDIRHPPASSFEFMLMKDELAVPVCCGDKLVLRWFFRADAANIIALYWEPIFDCEASCDQAANADDVTENNSDKNKPIGFKVYLLETEGIQTNSVLRSFKPVINCRTTNFLNEELQQLNINEAGIPITLRPHELLPLVCFVANS
jgi:hypothetical protein